MGKSLLTLIREQYEANQYLANENLRLVSDLEKMCDLVEQQTDMIDKLTNELKHRRQNVVYKPSLN